ncbi:hypothetical protein EZV62_018941 [Acer yangbiense]|uniref:AAA+ ATPase domain-containing protein n=1 Tax=Acer yangbiense TaxID=1000413 RepID=A0A5C7HAX7_9ROSI|nr:hypothetical protein EZV62_018941 [Acer yangbiense]
MVEIAIAVAAEIAKYLVAPVGPLQEKANQIIDDVSEVVGDNPEQANIQCCKGFSCPNLINRYQLSKKAADKLKDTTLQPSKGYVAFESRKSILKDIIDALCDPDVNMVRIYGMGGVGKTTLAREVASEAKQHNLFDKIIFVEMSESPDIQNIQGVIAGILGLQFKEETVPGRANKLCDQLKKEGKILLILDNIWKGIDFEKVGIPFKNDRKRLKLLLTTRNRDVLTNEMESGRNFSVHTLNEVDAWSIFKNTVGMCTEQPDLKSIAFEVAKECGGMPLAIVVIAKALKNKEEYAWKNALEELKNPSWESFERTMTKEVYTCIKYGLGLGFFRRSNTLENAQCKVEDLVKKLKDNSLLLDAPNETSESHFYSISDDERFAMHDVICDVARSIACEKGNVCTVIDDVISCSWAKMNILKNCNSITLHNIGELPKDLKLVLPQLEFFYMKTKNTLSRITDDFFTEMSSLLVLHLIEVNLSPLPTSLSHLVNLQTLCLDACKLGDVADIGKLEKLEFLSFCGSEIRELPEEMRQLTSIRLLDLNDCSKLEIIPSNLLSCFTQLEALYMYNTLIMWEVRGLKYVGRIVDELKHLRDRLTTLEISIPNVKMSKGLLSPHLKRYKISIDRNRISPPKNSRTLRVKLNTNDNVDEVISQLKGIKQLELTADSKQSVSLDALFSLESLYLKDLNFEKIRNVSLAAGSFCQLRTITVYRCDKLTNIFSFSIDRVLPKLREIRVSSCKNMEGIFAIEREDDVNNSELIHEIQFSQLCSVTLRRLPQLKSFCHRVKTTSQLQLTSSTNDGEIISEDIIDIPKSLFNKKIVFPNLETLDISNISAEKIWHNQLPTIFVQLQYLKISYCSLLKEVVFMEELREEEWKDTQFPFLKEMTITYCPNFKGFIFNDKIGFPSLKAMTIMSCPKFMEFIFNDKEGVVMEEAPTRFLFLKLTSLKLYRLPELRSFYPGRHKVELFKCGIHDTDEEGQMQQPSFFSMVEEAFPCLEELKLAGKNVTMLWQGQNEDNDASSSDHSE